jgi:class 3 adenylate cyclase
MASLALRRAGSIRLRGLVLAVAAGLLGLPLALWLDLRALSAQLLDDQAHAVGTLIDDVRDFYARNVVDRVIGADGPTRVVHNYTEIPGAIPIPATLSIELGQTVSRGDANIRYRFVSDFPFANRPARPLDGFERRALATLRADPQSRVVDVRGSIFDRMVRLATPIVMGQACVNCHNTHPDSPRHDWRVGDVRGIQEVFIRQPIEANIFAFAHLLVYFALAAAAGLALILQQRRQAAAVRALNRELESANGFLAGVSSKIARYLSPQISASIYSGRKDAVIHTERKELTIFFSDITDFTATTERLAPDALTALLNEYLAEMCAIALAHGGTVDKFMGDAILVFFGDPDSKGAAEDAQACLRMALAMQRRLTQLAADWRARGIERPFRARMGINTGACDVGNFGSNDRMDYTIIGAEANLAARLQSIAAPGGIVVSARTFALARDIIRARPLPAIAMKGISREIVPFAVDGLRHAALAPPGVV